MSSGNFFTIGAMPKKFRIYALDSQLNLYHAHERNLAQRGCYENNCGL